MAEQKREFKVGDKVRNVVPEDWQVKGYNATPGEVLEVRGAFTDTVSLYSPDGKYRYDSVKGHIRLAFEGLDDLQVDDVIVDDNNSEYTIAGIVGRAVFLEDNAGHEAGWYTVKELKDNDWTVKQPGEANEIVELTLEDVAKLKGVPVEKLRIKE